MTDSLVQLPSRPADAHKGHFGRVQIIGGSAGMSGAPALAGLAALRGGAGLVQVVCPAQIRSTVAALVPCATTAVLGDADEQQFDPTVRAVGPGCRDTISHTTLIDIAAGKAPVVIDADGLNRLAEIDAWWSTLGTHVVLTPHPGEMKRLIERTQLLRSMSPSDLAKEVALLSKATIVLKGHRTVVSDGNRTYENTTGNPGMATGGAGDVLTGVIAALIAQHLCPFDAACLGVYLHGLAGDLAAGQLGQISTTAMDLIECLPRAFQDYQRGGS